MLALLEPQLRTTLAASGIAVYNRLVTPRKLIAGLVVLVVAAISVTAMDYALLWRGDCPQPDRYRISRLRGVVVGKSLGFIQYRWLRRQFKAIGTILSLSTWHFEDRPGVGLVPTGKFVASLIVPDSGAFDFGELPPDEYALTVGVPGESAVQFRFTIDPFETGDEVLIDASPAYYCRCCGWNFEPH